MNKLICHMTHINNLENVIAFDGLLAKNEIESTPLHHENIANQDVQDKRSKVTVPLFPGGTLHDYVPFYFWGQTPMLLVNKPQQENIVFFVSYTHDILNSEIQFLFTDRHAVIKYANFYDNLDQLNSLDWKAIKEKHWGKDVDSKEKKQAEFLVYRKVSWNLIHGIGVMNDEIASNINYKLDNLTHKPIVKVKKEWYYL